MITKTDILIIGAGSAGFAAAYRALKNGRYKVTLVDKNPAPGGTSVFGGVNCWEPGVGGMGIHYEIAKRLLESGDGFVGKSTTLVTPTNRWATSDRSEAPYGDTLFRFGVTSMRRFHFEPEAMSKIMLDLLAEADSDGRLEMLFNSLFEKTDVKSGKILSCEIKTPDGIRIFEPKIVIDCSADIICARMAGCKTDIGEDSASTHGEEIAPEHGQLVLNGLTQCFRAEHCDGFAEDVPPEYSDVDLTAWNEYMDKINGPVSCFNIYPHGGISVNMLPTIAGTAILDYDFAELKHMLEARVYSYWKWLCKRADLTGWRVRYIFPMLGIRETWRLRGKYVLTHEDLLNGSSIRLGSSHTVAYADHPVDTHGATNVKGMRCADTGVYGIPYDCMLTNEIDNLLVACRGASFSHIAASSARLSRTMLSLGEAAGNAAVHCLSNRIIPSDVEVTDICTFMPQDAVSK